jgi:predicted membrane protein
MKSIAILLTFGAIALSQEGTAPITIPFSDAGRPKTVRASLMNGSLTVTGYEGKDVVIEARGAGSERRNRMPRGAEGMRRIDSGSSVTAEEENNIVRISSGTNGNLTIKVPYQTSLKLQCTNGGDIKVDHVTGDLELTNLNGNVIATAVSGSVIAHSLNGKVAVEIEKVTADKAMSFSTMNGDVDVTLPGDVRATLRMKSDNGEIFSDFDVKLTSAGTAPEVEDGRSKGGKYKVKVDKTSTGTVNGGGPDLTFKTYNGNVYIRKKK